MKHFLKYLIVHPLAAILVVLLVVFAGLALLLVTQTGTRLVAQTAEQFVPGLALNGVQGTLRDELTVKQVRWQDGETTVALDDVALKARMTPRLSPKADIKTLHAKRMVLTLPPAADDSDPFVFPDIQLPAEVTARDVKLDELVIQQGETVTRLRDLSLQGRAEQGVVTLDAFAGEWFDDDGSVAFTCEGELGLLGEHPLALKTDVALNHAQFGVGDVNLTAEGKVDDYALQSTGAYQFGDYPKQAVTLSGKGNLASLVLDKASVKSKAGLADLTGRVQWTPVPAWDVKMQMRKIKPGVVTQGVTGTLNADVTLKGELDKQLQTQVVVDRITGTVNDFPVDAYLNGKVAGEVVTLTKLEALLGDNRLLAQGTAEDKVSIQWQVDAPKLAQLHPELSGKLEGSGQLSGRLDKQAFRVAIKSLTGNVQGYPVKASGDVALNNKVVSAKNLKVDVGDNQLILNGDAAESLGVDWQVDARDLSALHAELSGQLQGKGQLSGRIDEQDFALNIETLSGTVRDYPIRATGGLALKDQVVSAKDLQVNVGANQVMLNGDAAESLGIDWQVDARNLKELHPELSGNVKGNGRLSGLQDGSKLELAIASLRGKIKGYDVQAKGKVKKSDEQFFVENIVVLAGGNELRVSGQAQEKFDLTWQVDAPNLAKAWQGLGGTLKGAGTLKGTLERPQINADLKGSQLRYQDMQLASLNLKATQQGERYDLKGDLKGFAQGETRVKAADFDVKGTLEQHTATVAVTHDEGRVQLTANGGWNVQQWRGRVNELALRQTVAGDWVMQKPVSVTAGADVFKASEACLRNQNGAAVCATTAWSAQGGVDARGRLQQVPLNMARAWLPADVKAPGVVNGDFRLAQRNGQPSGQVNLNFPDNTITFATGKGKAETLKYTRTRLMAKINQQRVDFNGQSDLQGRGQLQASGNLQLSPNDGQHRINAKLTANMPDIAWLEQFAPQIDDLKGQITSDVTINGVVNAPKITGVTRLQNASLFLPETGARLTNIDLTATANNAQQVAINGRLNAGQGTMTATGTLRLADLQQWQADVRLQGANLLLMNTHEIQAKVSPSLNVKASPGKVAITGRVLIPETTISLRELPPTASARSDDIVVVGRDIPRGQGGRVSTQAVIRQRNKEAPIAIAPDVVIELGDKVTFTGFGLDARLTGKMRVRQISGDISGEGAFSIVDGKYKAYGQDLKIERGRLLFNGPLDNPGMDIRAVRFVDDGGQQVGIALNGTLQSPESRLFSDPVQTQSDTLSYLLTGRAMSGVSGNESSMLLQAVNGLGIAGGESLAQSLGSKLGLDSVTLNSTGDDIKESELGLGKRLGPNLYVKYIVSLFDSMQRVALNYQINKRLQVEVQSGVEQSVDFIYKFDTDKGFLPN